MRVLLALILLMPMTCNVWGGSLRSTSSSLADREKELDARHCKTTYKRMINFVKYWPPAARQFSNYSMYNPKNIGFRGYDLLGDIYYRGCEKAGLQPDKAAAATWYQAGANAHLPESQFKLGRMLYEGDGITANFGAGIDWLTSAALEGSAEAAAFLSKQGMNPPNPVSPNTYTLLSQSAKAQMKAERAANRRAIFQDLAGALAASAYAALTVYNATQAQPHAQPTTRSHWALPTAPQTVTRFRPAYCQYDGRATSPTGDYVNISVSKFCH